MKVRYFENYDNYEATGNHEEIDIVKHGNKICADLITECKTYKTALNRFFKALKNYNQLYGWREGLLESCENGCFKDIETFYDRENNKRVYGNWHYEVEELDENLWYIELTTLFE